MYSQSNPKWVQAKSVEELATGDVRVKAYGETFTAHVSWNDPFLNKEKSDVLVQNSRGDWLRVWFYDKDIKR